MKRLLILLTAAGFSMGGCDVRCETEDRGPVEKAADAIEDAADEVRDAADDGADVKVRIKETKKP
jgi:hypothetical protein